MMTPQEEKKDEILCSGLVQVSDGKSRPRRARLLLRTQTLTVQEERPADPAPAAAPHARERMVQVTRRRAGGLGLSIKGGAEHKLPVLISKIYKDQAADQTGQLFVGDAVIKVNGEYITACRHDDAVSILRSAGDLVVLTVRHYRAATPFLMKHADGSDTDSAGSEPASLDPAPAEPPAAPAAPPEDPAAPEAPPEGPAPPTGEGPRAVDDNCNHSDADNTNGGWQSVSSGSRRSSVSSAAARSEWRDVVVVPLSNAYVTRYVPGTDKLRPGALEVRGARGESSGVLHAPDAAALSRWLKVIGDSIVGLTSLQMKALNRQLAAAGGARVEYCGWCVEAGAAAAGAGAGAGAGGGGLYRPRFLLLQGPQLLLFDVPPASAAELARGAEALRVYQTLFRVVRESETVDWRPHAFLLQPAAPGPPRPPRYFSMETRQELLRLEAAWTANIVNSVVRLGKKTFTVVSAGRAATLTLDWAGGFALSGSGADWAYRFSSLRGSSDDGKSKLKLHFLDPETQGIETKELECQILQSLLFCMHAFLTAKVASVDPSFLASVQRH